MTQRNQVRWQPSPAMYRHAGWLKPQRASRDDAQMLSRLAVKAVALAEEHGEVLTRKAALQRVRANLVFVRAMAGAPDIEREASDE